MPPVDFGLFVPFYSMRIIVDYTSAIRQTAGIGRITQELIRHFPWQEAGLELSLFVSGQEKSSISQVQGANLHFTPFRERDMTRLWHRAHCPFPRVEWFSGGKAEMFHATDFVLPPSSAPCQILTVHDLAFWKYQNLSVPSLAHYLETVVPRSVARADFIFADSHSTARDLHDLLKVSNDRIAVVPGGVDLRAFARVTDGKTLKETRSRYGIGDAPYILALSTIQPRKNFNRLVGAFARISDDYPDTMLVIGGKRGWNYRDLFARVMDLGLQDRVLFPGFIEDLDLPALYSGALLFAYPSLYEGFGMPILEAMACGTPVLTGSNSSLAEAGGPGALYADVLNEEYIADGLEKILSDPNLRREMIAAGTSHAARMSWERSALLMWHGYQQAWDSIH